jgi:hypothetical protein
LLKGLTALGHPLDQGLVRLPIVFEDAPEHILRDRALFLGDCLGFGFLGI